MALAAVCVLIWPLIWPLICPLNCPLICPLTWCGRPCMMLQPGDPARSML